MNKKIIIHLKKTTEEAMQINIQKKIKGKIGHRKTKTAEKQEKKIEKAEKLNQQKLGQVCARYVILTEIDKQNMKNK